MGRIIDGDPIEWAAKIVDRAEMYVGRNISPCPPTLSAQERIQAIAIVAALDIQRRLLQEQNRG